ATGRYHLSDKPFDAGAETAIIDEASMLTEEMLGAVLQALGKVKRVILVGDPRQLPPIGAGRPFVDVVNELAPPDLAGRFPRVAPGYAELTVRMRQAGTGREDLQFAEWFSGAAPGPGEDEVFDRVLKADSQRIRFVSWESAEDCHRKLL